MVLYHKKSSKWWKNINCDWGYRHESGNWSPVVQSDTINEVSPASYETNFDLSVAKTFFMSEEALIQSVLYQMSDISSEVAHEHILCKYTILSDNAIIHILLNYYFGFMLCNMSYSVLCPKGFCWVVQRLQQALQRYTGALHGLCTSQVNCNCLF